MPNLPREHSSAKTRILIAVTSPLSCNFYNGLLGHLHRAGFEPTLLSAPGDNLVAVSSREGVANIALPMEREIAPIQDLVSFCRLYRTVRRLGPTVADASTPKAGLLTGVAAWLARVPCRVYTLRGLRLETATGLKRALLWVAEWISCKCAHRVVCVSPSLRARAIGLKLVGDGKAIVLGEGSGGVDIRRFSPAGRESAETQSLREKLGIAANALVIGFVGRLVRDKGIRELIEAFQGLNRKQPDLRLLLVGDFEQGDPVEPEIRRFIESSPAMIRPGFVSDTAPYYGLMDVLALPTYREGFPGVPLEAQASGVPVVTTTATGALDSVVDGETGFLVPIGDSRTLADAIAKLLEDPQLRLRMGIAGRARMQRDFRQEAIWDAHVNLYQDLLKENVTMRDKRPGKSIAQRTAGLVAKRAFDLVGAIAGLVVLAPLLLTVAALVRIFLGSPILFRQSRPGWNGKLFMCLKFRTMTDARDAEGRLLADAERMTGFGRFLRRSSIDELPELINVIRGDMSLVGPRPLLPQYLERYTAEQMRRHEVKPGITGWAQVNGRNSANWEQKFAYDIWYVGNRSFWLDLKILVLTLWRTLTREGISQPGHATMPEFFGVGAESEHGGAR
jgi:lipopolysaccharide/colanic/teichoic acid biosynthesis glycosyltransferase